MLHLDSSPELTRARAALAVPSEAVMVDTIARHLRAAAPETATAELRQVAVSSAPILQEIWRTAARAAWAQVEEGHPLRGVPPVGTVEEQVARAANQACTLWLHELAPIAAPPFPILRKE